MDRAKAITLVANVNNENAKDLLEETTAEDIVASEHAKDKMILSNQIASLTNLFENLQREYSVLKTEKEKTGVESQKEIHELREAIRCLTDTNEKLESDKKTLQQLLEAKDKAEKRRREKSYAEAVSSKSAEFDPDDWIPKYDPKTKPIIIGDSDSSDSSPMN